MFFADDGDYEAFLEALRHAHARYPFRLFGYFLMTNLFHLLLQPEPGQAISRILKSLTVGHTWRYHRRIRSSGHVWQGRFRSPVIQNDEHLIVVLRYIEANPLRASMVANLGDYRWSSYQNHGLGRPDALLGSFSRVGAIGADRGPAAETVASQGPNFTKRRRVESNSRLCLLGETVRTTSMDRADRGSTPNRPPSEATRARSQVREY
jgi:putative transposase